MSVTEFLEKESQRRQLAFYNHVRLWIGIGAAACRAAHRRLTHAEYLALFDCWGGANSYERRLLVPILDDEALCRHAEYCMSQVGRELGEHELAQHYGDAVQREIAPLLVERLREHTNPEPREGVDYLDPKTS